MAAALAELEPDSRIRFIGTRRGLESRVVPEHSYPIDYISIEGLLGKGLGARIKFPILMAISIVQCLSHLRRNRPEVVLGTGGYVCAPPVLAAKMLGIPVALLALDAMPSQAVRQLSRLADQVYSGFPECSDNIPRKEIVTFTGNPIRPEIAMITRDEGIKEFGLDPNKKTVLVFGGSQGAHSLNLAMISALKHLESFRSLSRIQFLFQTGPRDFDMISKNLGGFSYPVKIMAYIEKMPQALAASDLVVSRSGASVSEVLARGVPSILVPYPHAASNHQEHNARSLERAGAAIVILDRDLDGRLLAERIISILEDKERYSRMSQAARSMARPGAAQDIARKLMELAA